MPADSSLVSSIEGKDGGIERTVCTAHHYHLIPIPTLCPVDCILAAMERERTTYCYRSYFGGGPTATTRDLLPVVVSPLPMIVVLTSESRERVCEWFYAVVDRYDLSRETAAASMALLDRFLAIWSQKKSEENLDEGNSDSDGSSAVLLSAMTCLQLTIKINEPRIFCLGHFCHLSNRRLSPVHIE